MSIRDRVAMHVAVGEMIYSPKLNEAYMAFANGRRAYQSPLISCYWFPCSCVQPPLHGEGIHVPPCLSMWGLLLLLLP